MLVQRLLRYAVGTVYVLNIGFGRSPTIVFEVRFKIFQRIPYGRFLLRWTLGLLRIFGLRLMVVLSYLQTAFLLDLRDIQGRYLQSSLFQHAGFDFRISRTRFP